MDMWKYVVGGPNFVDAWTGQQTCESAVVNRV